MRARNIAIFLPMLFAGCVSRDNHPAHFRIHEVSFATDSMGLSSAPGDVKLFQRMLNESNAPNEDPRQIQSEINLHARQFLYITASSDSGPLRGLLLLTEDSSSGPGAPAIVLEDQKNPQTTYYLAVPRKFSWDVLNLINQRHVN